MLLSIASTVAFDVEFPRSLRCSLASMVVDARLRTLHGLIGSGHPLSVSITVGQRGMLRTKVIVQSEAGTVPASRLAVYSHVVVP